MTITEAAKKMNISPQALRVALQQGRFDFGVAIRQKRWSYYINERLFNEYLEGRNEREVSRSIALCDVPHKYNI